MNPEFTAAQLARQRAVDSEEKLSLATMIISILAATPLAWILAVTFPPLLIVPPILFVVDTGFKINRHIVRAREQKELNDKKKELLLKKESLLNQIDKLDGVKKPSSPININLNDFMKKGEAQLKKRVIDTALVKPSNIMLNSIKKLASDLPQNIQHKR
jgi:hypothetical protein